MRTRDPTDSRRTGWNVRIRPERYRERILDVVQSRELPVSLAELADDIADRQEQSVRGDTDQIRIRLHHVDLPKLQERGVLAYDASRNVVADCF